MEEDSTTSANLPSNQHSAEGAPAGGTPFIHLYPCSKSGPSRLSITASRRHQIPVTARVVPGLLSDSRTRAARWVGTGMAPPLWITQPSRAVTVPDGTFWPGSLLFRAGLRDQGDQNPYPAPGATKEADQ